MTKSQQIMDLYDGKRTTKEIGEIVGCHDAYVRVVLQRRAGNNAAKRYELKVTQFGDRVAARAAARLARKAGGNVGSAYRRVMVQTGREVLRRQEAKP